MALRARLNPPRPTPQSWRWHQAKVASISASLLMGRERRMEAETYLADGYGLRLAMQSRKDGWLPLARLARVSQPARLKGIQVSPIYGVPYLAATQVFDIRPTPRKWLALERTRDADALRVKSGLILVSRSGTVGRTTVATRAHEGALISDDLLRVSADEDWAGWLYGYLRCTQAHSMMVSEQYGHIIKHLEVKHLNAVPVPLVNRGHQESFSARCRKILEKRNVSAAKLAEAEQLFTDAVGPLPSWEELETGFSLPATELFAKRRRIEASYHHPRAAAILQGFKDNGKKVERLLDVAERVWWMKRFKRVFGDAGVPYVSADELFSLNPRLSKRVLVEQADHASEFFVREGWLVMACSGQVYGLNGSVALMTKYHEQLFFSHDLIRIVPRLDRVRPGYLYVALGHPELGRPLVIRYAYGTSIPHLEPLDVQTFPLVRLGSLSETRIAELAEEAVALRSEADEIENSLASDAETLVTDFLAGDRRNSVLTLAE
jgi:hypothetical protein